MDRRRPPRNMRGRMMAKLGVKSVADLVRLADKAGITPAYG